MRLLLVPITVALAAAPVAAQGTPAANQHAGHAAHAAHAAHAGQAASTLPTGWVGRTDRGQPLAGAKFVTMGKGFHVTTGPSAVFANNAWNKKGDYKVAASFTQTKAPEHPEAYGLVVGARHLDVEGHAYSYFLVRGTGEYFIATRKGAQRSKVVDWTAHQAVKKQDASGKQTNKLGVEVRGNEVVFSVNDVEVARRPKSEIVTDGLVGYRVNHNLDVHIDPVG